MKQRNLVLRRNAVAFGLAISALAGAVVLGGTFIKAQTPPLGKRPSLAVIDDQAGTMRDSADPAVIRPLIESLFGFSLFSSAPKSFRDRLLTTEVNFRKNRMGIGNGALVKAVNGFALTTSLPRYSSAIPEQVVALRLKLLKYFPNILGSLAGGGSPGYQTMSPIGAFFLADLLLRQKLTNPAYQVTPDEWRQQSLREQPRPPQGLFASLEPPEVTAFLNRLKNEFPLEGSSSAVALTVFFDGVGF